MKTGLRETLGILVRNLFSLLFRMLWIFPVNKNRVFFQSYESAVGYRGNPKYLCESLRQSGGNLDLVFALRRDLPRPQVPGVRFVTFQSPAWFYALATSGTVVWNVRAPLFLSRRKNQLIINTWHAGGAYKKTGVSASGVGGDKMLALSNERNRKYFNLFLSSSEKFAETNIRRAFGYEGKILDSGMPRNDLFFDGEAVARVRESVRKSLNLGDAFVVLIAPTFRSDGIGENMCFASFPFGQVKQVLEQETSRPVVFLLRKHHKDPTPFRFEGKIVDVSAWEDVQELLCAADLLVTDYSSVMWDFCLLKRPILLYAPDAEKYEQSDRGFFTPIRSWPGILCEGPEKMADALQELSETDFPARYDAYLRSMGSCENGNACKLVRMEMNRSSGKREEAQ